MVTAGSDRDGKVILISFGQYTSLRDSPIFGIAETQLTRPVRAKCIKHCDRSTYFTRNFSKRSGAIVTALAPGDPSAGTCLCHHKGPKPSPTYQVSEKASRIGEIQARHRRPTNRSRKKLSSPQRAYTVNMASTKSVQCFGKKKTGMFP